MPAPVPIRKNSPGSSSHGLGVSFRVRSRPSPAGYPKVSDNLPCDLLPPSRHELEESTCRRASQARLRSDLGVSHALAVLLLLEPCGLVSSHSHVRDLHVRGFPRHLAATIHHRSVPSCRLPRLPVVGRTRPLQPTRRRLQGIDPDSDPLLPTGCLGLSTPDPLLRFHLPRVCLRTPWNRFTAPPLMVLATGCCVSTRTLTSSVSIGARPASVSPSRRSRSSFVAFRRAAEATLWSGPGLSSGPLRPPNSPE